jgi:hypothetical protein
MSAPNQPDAVEQDCKQVLAFLAKKGFVPSEISELFRGGVRRIHRSTYSICIWSHFLNLPEHGQVYLNELASDAIQILPHSTMGFKKSSGLHTRGIIENLMRHVYFLDHRIEYQRQNLDLKWYMSAEQLFDYARNHPLFTQTEAKFNALGRLRQFYSEISAEVHGAKTVHLDQHTALKDLMLDMEIFKKQVVLTEKTVASVNFLLVVFHAERLIKIPANFQKVLFSTMPSRARQVAKGLI